MRDVKTTQDLLELADAWYEYHYSVLIFTPGEIVTTKGPWTDVDHVAAFLEERSKLEKDDPSTVFVAASRCGALHVESAHGWLQAHHIMREVAEAEDAYIAAGVCRGCGACSLLEARTKCKPNDDSCPGEPLWQDQQEDE